MTHVLILSVLVFGFFESLFRASIERIGFCDAAWELASSNSKFFKTSAHLWIYINVSNKSSLAKVDTDNRLSRGKPCRCCNKLISEGFLSLRGLGVVIIRQLRVLFKASATLPYMSLCLNRLNLYSTSGIYCNC